MELISLLKYKTTNYTIFLFSINEFLHRDLKIKNNNTFLSSVHLVIIIYIRMKTVVIV